MRSSGNPAQRVIQCLHAQLGPLPVSRLAVLHELIVHVGQHGIVNLQDQTGVDDLQILFAQRLSNGEDVIAIVLVVLVRRVVARCSPVPPQSESLLPLRQHPGHL